MQPDVTWDRDSQQRFLERIAAESARLGRLVDDLLDFSAIESGVMRLQRDWCDIPLVIEAAIGCLSGAEAQDVIVRCDPALPVIWADHDRLEQVFVNLVGNALRHNPPGTRVTVTARSMPGDGPVNLAVWGSGAPLPGEVEIDVTDDGTGMPGELARDPFEPDRRHRSPTAGAGLGLSIARGIVGAHGGHIELRPVVRGTCFRIRLPVEAAGRPGPDVEGRDGGGGRDAAEAGAGLPSAGAPIVSARRA
jgi:signal transduction histidine kinase